MSATNEPYSEIAMLVHKYADAVVHRNGEQWSSTWAEDAVWDLGGGRLVEGLDAIKQLWYGAMKGFEATIQTVLNGGVEIDPSEMLRVEDGIFRNKLCVQMGIGEFSLHITMTNMF